MEEDDSEPGEAVVSISGHLNYGGDDDGGGNAGNAGNAGGSDEDEDEGQQMSAPSNAGGSDGGSDDDDGGQQHREESSWSMYDPRTLTDNVIVEGSNGGGAAEGQHPMLMSAPNEIDGSNKKGGKRWKTLGCTPSLHRNSLLQDFFELGGYRCFPDAVMCEVMFRELLAVDAVNCTYTVDFILTTRWYDRTFDTPQYHGRSNIEVFAKTIPHLTIKDVDFSFEGKNIPDVGRIGDEHHQGFVHLRRAKDPPGVLYRSQRIQVKLRDVNTLEMFPFDKQILELCLRLPGSDDPSSIDYGKVILPLNVVMQLANDPIDWQVYPATASSRRSRGDRQMFVATLHVKRKPRYYEINIFLALFLISTLIFGVFSIPANELGSRLEAGLAALLNTVAYKWFVSDYLPKVPYLTLMDIYIYGALMMSLTVIAEAILVVQFFCKLDGSGEELECKLAEMHEFEREFSWPLLRYWIAFNLIFVLIAIAHRDYFLEKKGENHPCITDNESRKNAGDVKSGSANLQARKKELKTERAYFKPAYDQIVKRREQAVRAIRILEQVVERRESKTDTDHSKHDKVAVWWQNVRHNSDKVFRRSGEQLDWVNRVCRTRQCNQRRGALLDPHAPLRKFEVQCYIWSLAGRSHSEPSNGRLHWLARASHQQRIVELLLKDDAFQGDTREMQNDRSGLKFDNDTTNEGKKMLLHFKHAKKVAQDDIEKVQPGDGIENEAYLRKLVIRGSALQNDFGHQLIEFKDTTTNVTTNALLKSATEQRNAPAAQAPATTPAATEEPPNSQLMIVNIPRLSGSQLMDERVADEHCDILASAALVQYILRHSPANEKIEIQNENTIRPDDLSRPQKGKWQKFMIGPDSFEFIQKISDDPKNLQFTSTFERMKDEKNFFIKLKAAAFASDTHWSDDNPLYWSNAKRLWEPHKISRREMLEQFLPDETNAKEQEKEFYQKLYDEKYKWVRQFLFGVGWQRHLKEGRGGEKWSFGVDAKSYFERAKHLLAEYNRFVKLPQRKLVGELAEELWKVLNAQKHLPKIDDDDATVGTQLISVIPTIAVSEWIDSMPGVHGVLCHELLNATFAYTQTGEFITKHGYEFVFETRTPAERSYSEFKVLVRTNTNDPEEQNHQLATGVTIYRPSKSRSQSGPSINATARNSMQEENEKKRRAGTLRIHRNDTIIQGYADGINYLCLPIGHGNVSAYIRAKYAHDFARQMLEVRKQLHPEAGSKKYEEGWLNEALDDATAWIEMKLKTCYTGTCVNDNGIPKVEFQMHHFFFNPKDVDLDIKKFEGAEQAVQDAVLLAHYPVKQSEHDQLAVVKSIVDHGERCYESAAQDLVEEHDRLVKARDKARLKADTYSRKRVLRQLNLSFNAEQGSHAEASDNITATSIKKSKLAANKDASEKHKKAKSQRNWSEAKKLKAYLDGLEAATPVVDPTNPVNVQDETGEKIDEKIRCCLKRADDLVTYSWHRCCIPLLKDAYTRKSDAEGEADAYDEAEMYDKAAEMAKKWAEKLDEMFPTRASDFWGSLKVHQDCFCSVSL